MSRQAVIRDADASRLSGPAITDVAGEAAGRVQVKRLVERYHWAASYCAGRTVLEVACGTGQGLGLLRSRASKLHGCDLSEHNLASARATCARDVNLVRADAQILPFAAESIDVVILLETLYFLPTAGNFLSEARRVLRPGGRLLISSINKDCPDFNPNHPLYFAHYGVVELEAMLTAHGFATECFGIIPMDMPSLRSRVFKPIKRIAIRLDLIPDSMQARLLLKRLVFGRLETMPRDIIDQPAPATMPERLPSGQPDRVHQVVLCAGARGDLPFPEM